jgi:hypothetical protein
MNHGAIGHRAVSIIADVVRGARCYILESGRIEPTCDLMEELVA